MVSRLPAEQRMLGVTDHIMKTLLNIIAALSLGSAMVLFIVI